jgi:hypothetical protein
VLGTWTAATRPHETPGAAAYFTGHWPMRHMPQLHPDSDSAFPTCSPPQRQRALGFGDRRSAEQASADLETMAAAGSSPSSSSSKRCVPCSFLHPLSLHGSRAWVPCSSTPPCMASLVLCSTARLLLLLKPCLLKTRPIMQDLDQSFPFVAAKCDESEDPPSQSTVLFLVECDAMAEKAVFSSFGIPKNL